MARWHYGPSVLTPPAMRKYLKIRRSGDPTAIPFLHRGGNHHQRDSYHDAGISVKQKELFARKPLTLFVMFTMYFQGGLIPTYLWMNDLHLYNTPWVMVLLPAINVFNLIIAINYISNSIPEELYEAASIDGCSHIRYFFSIVLPLSKTIVVVLVLYYGVAHWNEFMNGLIYLRDEGLYPLQLTLRNILLQNQASGLGDVDSIIEQQKAAELIKYGVIIVSTLPVLVIYPFLQKHFAKGVMVGSVKG